MQVSLDVKCQAAFASDPYGKWDWNHASVLQYRRESQFWDQVVRHQRGFTDTDTIEHDRRGLQSCEW